MTKKTNELFLLSVDEYERFKDNIPHINAWWWLRSPGDCSRSTADVSSDGSVCEGGSYVSDEDEVVRPAFVLDKENYDEYGDGYSIGERYYSADFPFVYIGSSKKYYWFIAEVPMAFDKFDDKSNDYNNSYIKNELLPKLAKKYHIFDKYNIT